MCGPSIILKISALDVGAAIDKMKQSKSNRNGTRCLRLQQMKLDVDDDACNAVVKDGEIPEKWRRSWMVNVYKGKVLHQLVAHTLHYLILSSFHTPFTPKAISGASTKLYTTGSVCQ